MASPLRRTDRSRQAPVLARLWDSSRRFRAVVFAQAIVGLIVLVWIYGGLQSLELLVYDMLRVSWAGHAASDRVLLIGATESDLVATDAAGGLR